MNSVKASHEIEEILRQLPDAERIDALRMVKICCWVAGCGRDLVDCDDRCQCGNDG